ncbi:hypothetical protein ElyMa_005539200 [Elysia marginata]|uniref:Uncharacterized protein n=1 Tax=Elysia marginata TaxID=1093978 RepID=A0AAV4EXU5_9GAST|nr:hypothetical protein ElyMa_005539200 [Elysia marginata]
MGTSERSREPAYRYQTTAQKRQGEWPNQERACCPGPASLQREESHIPAVPLQYRCSRQRSLPHLRGEPRQPGPCAEGMPNRRPVQRLPARKPQRCPVDRPGESRRVPACLRQDTCRSDRIAKDR